MFTFYPPIISLIFIIAKEMTHLMLGIILGSFTTYIVTKIFNKNKINKLENIWESHKIKMGEKIKYLEEYTKKLENDLSKLKNSYSIKIDELVKTNAEKSILKQIVSKIPKLEAKIENKSSAINEMTYNNVNLEKKVSELTTLLASERKYFDNRRNTLNILKDEIIDEFKTVMGGTFENEGVKFQDYSRTQINTIIQPLKHQITEFKKRVEDVYDKESKDRYVLLNEISKLKTLNESISRDAVNLTNALKGDVKIQGGWGEIILERVLETSGLQKGRSYDLQVQLRQANGNTYKPDAVIHLPQGKDVVVDSKVSLKSYESYCSSETEQERKAALKQHLLSLRSHIKRLSIKCYERLEGIKSLDFVLMFVPIEEAFLVAIKKDSSIMSEAFNGNIFIVCPSTLLITLRTINNIWQNADQNHNSAQIAKCASEMHDKFVSFLYSVEDIGKHLTKAIDSHTLAKNRLVSGKGNLIKRAQNIKSLGLKTKKTVPKSLIN